MATEDVILIGVSTPVEDVLKYDSEGRKLRFDEENFLELPKEAVQKLSKKTRTQYNAAYVDWKYDNDPTNGEVSEEMIVSPESLRLQNTEMLNVRVKPGLHGYHATPQQVEKLKRQGFRFATDSDLAEDNTGSRHVKVGGYTDNILMVRDEELNEKFKAESRKRRQLLASGKQTFEDTDKKLKGVDQKLDFEEYSVSEDEVDAS